METVLVVSSVLLWLVVLCNLLLTLVLVRRVNTNGSKTNALATGGLDQNTPAPDFSAETLNGNRANLSTFTDAGKQVAFIFISTHCEPCREVLAMLKEQDTKAAVPSGTELVFVSGDEREPTEAMVEELQVDWPVLIAPRNTNSFFSDYKISATPSYCLINAQGEVQATGIASNQRKVWKAVVNTWTSDDLSTIGERR
ncbi:hypothetical protein KSF_011750 [Reticulibacter mediterranei]|uniref:Thioredoxin domain-containing protein n=1 Tax=Reticulibacter mediterranei TaxID=2778369 RepID=A0A8J3N1A6_9CHLR|nr:TlpA disulfide reductase family protein [Reticulibacter mediterranei]GHO91127.1 hypothetical protein KSF_011750 [Reticulibacter mediterranei]